MTEEKLLEILNSIKKKKIGVIGDFCLDCYWLLDDGPIECSIETQKKTFGVRKQKYSLGGAGNVVWNLNDIGVEKVFAFGVIGDDLFGREMVRKMNTLNVDTSSMIIQSENWDTPAYSKPFMGLEEQERIDFGRYNKISEKSETVLLNNFKSALPELDAVIVNQQLVNGIHSYRLVSQLNEIFIDNPEKIFLIDSRHKNNLYVNIIPKMNASEAASLCGLKTVVSDSISVDDLKIFARKIYFGAQRPVFISRGERGILIYDGSTYYEIPGLLITGKIDTVGAGDTLAAALTASLSTGASPEDAATLANLASGITIQKLQVTGTANPEEIIDMYRKADYIYNPELADDARKSKFYPGTEFEITNFNSKYERIEHVLFDHDGTISVLREGWEDIMEPMMVKSVLGKSYDTINEEMYQRVKKRVKEYIDQSTGIETIVQMQSLQDMVKEFQIVPKNEILTPIEYKQIYNDDLMKKVNYRIQKFASGELCVDDFVIKGVLGFLELLKQNNIKVYLASGTDTEDVKREAKSLGYDHYFGEHIYGSLGYKSTNAKRMVIENIIKKNNLKGSNLAAFGDGPVELREVKKVGGIAVGIASDEIRRYGINQTKRSRLIKSGADVIIRDYSAYNKLFEALFVKNIFEVK